MAAKTQRIEVMLETLLESVDLAESISMRVAEAAGFPEEEVHKIGMAVREGVINAYNYGNQQDRHKKIMMTVELQPDNMIFRVLDQGKGFELTKKPTRRRNKNFCPPPAGAYSRGEGSAQVCKSGPWPINSGKKKILLSLYDVDYIDSSGIGELVSAYRSE